MVLVPDLIAGVERPGGGMAGIVTIRVERTSNIVTGRNFLKREFLAFESSI